MKNVLVFLLLGTNLKDRKENLKSAIEEIEKEGISFLKVSSIYKSEAWGFESENYFLNQGLSFYTDMGPKELLKRMKQIEAKLGRIAKTTENYVDRIIDIDILFYGDEIINTEQLKVPHPRIAERKFTLVALSDIAPEFKHPVYDKSISELLRLCADSSEVTKL